MKKNLLTIIILALLLVNIILTAIMMFNVTSTNKKVANLVANITTALNLELTTPGQETPEETVSLADTEIYAITGSMTMPSKSETVTDANGKQVTKQGYLVCNVSFSMNTKHKDYKKYGSAEEMSAREALLKDEINRIVSSHTMSELQEDVGLDSLKKEILKAVQDLYQSDFIYKVSISDVKFGGS